MSKIIQKRSAGGIIYHDGRVLVIKVIPEDEIVFPKGTIESDETPEQAAVREIFEETGYKAKIKAPLGSVTYEFDEDDGRRYRKTVLHYLLELEDAMATPTPHRTEGENFENIWLTIDQAFSRLTHDDSKEILQKAVGVLKLSK